MSKIDFVTGLPARAGSVPALEMHDLLSGVCSLNHAVGGACLMGWNTPLSHHKIILIKSFIGYLIVYNIFKI